MTYWSRAGAAQLIAFGVSILTLGIAYPPLFGGLYLLVQRQFDGEPISPGEVLDGFEVSWPAWGVTALMVLLSMVAGVLVVDAGILGMALASAVGLPQSVQMLPLMGL